MGGTIPSSAVLVIKDGVSKLVNVTTQVALTKLLDMVPDFVEKFTKKEKEEPENTQE